jgi:SSS family solute:Na+ symporter
MVWQFAFQLAAATTWQTQISRVLAAKDADTAKRMYRRTSFYFVGRFLLPGLWGAAAFVWFTKQGGLPENLTSLTAMPHYLSIVLPIGVIGIVVAAMLAAEMSTDSGYMLTWATVIYNDVVTPVLKRPLSPKGQLLLTRGLVLAIAIFLLFYGLWYELPGNAWDYLAVTGNIYLASVFTLLVAGLYWPRANATGAAAALVLGAIGPITFLLIGKAYQIPPEVAGASSFGLAALGMIAGSLLSRAPASKSA